MQEVPPPHLNGTFASATAEDLGNTLHIEIHLLKKCKEIIRPDPLGSFTFTPSSEDSVGLLEVVDNKRLEPWTFATIVNGFADRLFYPGEGHEGYMEVKVKVDKFDMRSNRSFAAVSWNMVSAGAQVEYSKISREVKAPLQMKRTKQPWDI